MDRRLPEPGEPGQEPEPEAAALRRPERQHGGDGLEGRCPGEVWQGEDGVEGAQLRHPPVEGVGLLTEEDRLGHRLDQVAHAQSEGQEEQGPAARGGVRHEVLDEQPAAVQQEHGAHHPRDVEGQQQRQVQQRRQVPEGDPVDEEVDRLAGLGRVAVGPGPSAVVATTHLGQVGVGVVTQEEEAHEGASWRRGEVGVDVGQQGESGQDQPQAQPERRPPPEAGGGGQRPRGAANRHA